MTVDPNDVETFRRATRASDEGVARVRSGVDGAVPTGEAVGSVLRAHLPAASPAAVGRVKRAVLAANPRPVGSGTLLARRLGVGAAAAAVVGLVVSGLFLAWPTGPVPLDTPLSDAVVDAGTLQLRDLDGRGHLGGTSEAPTVAWDVGTLTVAGVGVVRTREAVVTLAGPPITLERSVEGTRVQGDARVSCLAPDAVPGHDCPPVSAAGRLALAAAREQAGDSPGRVLEIVDGGLALPDDGLAHAELRAARVAALHALGARGRLYAEARRVVEDNEGTRVDEVARRAASVALSTGDCDTARPFLEHLAPRDTEAAGALTRCETAR